MGEVPTGRRVLHESQVADIDAILRGDAYVEYTRSLTSQLDERIARDLQNARGVEFWRSQR